MDARPHGTGVVGSVGSSNTQIEELRAGVHTQSDNEAGRLTLEEIFIRVIGKEDGAVGQHAEQELSWLG